MEFAIPGFIKRYCTPNALTTLTEYLVDYASPETREAGERQVERELSDLPDAAETLTRGRIETIRAGDERDLYV
jgi:2-iminoacetate synthase